jgi:hypothetical protein
MQPIVNGLENEYGSEIEFVKINIDDPDSAAAKQEYGFRYQPFFVLVSADGEVLQEPESIAAGHVELSLQRGEVHATRRPNYHRTRARELSLGNHG